MGSVILYFPMLSPNLPMTGLIDKFCVIFHDLLANFRASWGRLTKFTFFFSLHPAKNFRDIFLWPIDKFYNLNFTIFISHDRLAKFIIFICNQLTNFTIFSSVRITNFAIFFQDKFYFFSLQLTNFAIFSMTNWWILLLFLVTDWWNSWFFSSQLTDEFCDIFLWRICKVHVFFSQQIDKFCDFFFRCNILTKFMIFFLKWLMNFAIFSPQPIEEIHDLFSCDRCMCFEIFFSDWKKKNPKRVCQKEQ